MKCPECEGQLYVEEHTSIIYEVTEDGIMIEKDTYSDGAVTIICINCSRDCTLDFYPDWMEMRLKQHKTT